MDRCRHMLIGVIFVTLTVFVPCSILAQVKGKLYVVGMGPAGPNLTAPRALEIVEKADVLLCSPRIPERFAAFGRTIDPSKIAFDPWKRVFDKKAKHLKRSDPGAWADEIEMRRKEVQKFVLQKINDGKTVVMMDGGDPCVYGPSLHYLLEGFDPSLFEVVPGMGAFNAAGAALKQSFTPEDVRFVLLTSPQSLFGENWEKNDKNTMLRTCRLPSFIMPAILTKKRFSKVVLKTFCKM